MTSKKKSFLLHIDSLDILDDLTNGQAGVLFKAIKAYQQDENFPLDSIVKIAFSPFKNQFLRDDEKYIKTCERRAIAGSKGGKQKVANASKCKQEVANVADSNNKNKNKTNNKSDSNNKDIVQQAELSPFDFWWDRYPKKQAKVAAEKIFNKKIKGMNEEKLNLFMDNICNHSTTVYREVKKEFIPMPTSYLNQERYNDE